MWPKSIAASSGRVLTADGVLDRIGPAGVEVPVEDILRGDSPRREQHEEVRL
jgi:hypothetical protein